MKELHPASVYWADTCCSPSLESNGVVLIHSDVCLFSTSPQSRPRPRSERRESAPCVCVCVCVLVVFLLFRRPSYAILGVGKRARLFHLFPEPYTTRVGWPFVSSCARSCDSRRRLYRDLSEPSPEHQRCCLFSLIPALFFSTACNSFRLTPTASSL